MALTDGALRWVIGQELMSFVEVKKKVRCKDQDAILMQQGSVMVRWILEKQPRYSPKQMS
jgi:hypothetical protein